MGRVLAAFCLLASVARGDEIVVESAGTTVVVKQAAPEAPVRGPNHAPVTVELFCAYQLPQCRDVNTALTELSARHPERLRILYRQFPVAYRDGQMLAEAALEAWDQGRFLELHDAIYAKHGQLGRDDLLRAAAGVGLDATRLEAALDDHRQQSRLDEDARWKETFGIHAIPAMVWNGQLVESGSAGLDDLEKLYDAAYAEAQLQLDDGVPIGRLYRRQLKAAAAHRREVMAHSREAAGEPPEELVTVPIDGAPARGGEDAEVTIVTFSDFECPFCKRLQGTLREVEDVYPGRVRIVWKSFPLQFHPNARPAAEAAMCAHAQGRFWAYHDMLFDNADRLRRASLLDYARRVGIDADQLGADLDAGRCAAAVDQDVADGKALGVSATPTMFVNGRKLVGYRSAAELRAIVEEELAPGFLEELTAE